MKITDTNLNSFLDELEEREQKIRTLASEGTVKNGKLHDALIDANQLMIDARAALDEVVGERMLVRRMLIYKRADILVNQMVYS
jgi:hypothetical protein